MILVEWRPIAVRLVDQPAVCVSTALLKYSVDMFLREFQLRNSLPKYKCMILNML